ncbi:MAG: hypothetical protein Q7U04_13890 [Bacteriovorax sp.]|nr:hypothetical protein [Bacteriovorax sp.]
MRILLTFLALFSFGLLAQEQVPYTVYLKAGAILTKITDKSEMILSKGIYAKVLEINAKRKEVFNVYDKNNIAQYLVSAVGIVEIAEDAKILPSLDPLKEYPAKSSFKAINKLAQFDSQLSLHFDSLQVSELNNIYNDQTSSVLSSRYELRTLYVSNLPIEFGFVLNYQSAYWKNDIEEVKLSILTFGPQFKYNFFVNEDLNFHALMSSEVAPIYQGSTALYNDKYSAIILDFGIESEWATSLGKFEIGGHLRHHKVSLTKSNRENLELLPKELSLNSLGVMIGYKMDWDL